jgi:hypothetical protein
MLSGTTSSSDGNHGSGLWLWHGKAPLPLPQSSSQPASRVRHIPGPNVSALRRGGWWMLPGGLALTSLGVALTLLAVMLYSTPPNTTPPADTAAAVISGPPVDILASRAEYLDTPLDQAQMPSTPAAPLPARGTEHERATKVVRHTSARTVRNTHALTGRNSPFVIHGVLTPPDLTVRHDGGH